MSSKYRIISNEGEPAAATPAAPPTTAPAATPAPVTTVANTATPPAPTAAPVVRPQDVMILDESTGRPIDNADAGDRTVIQIGNASVALATAPTERLTSYVSGLPVQPVEETTNFLFPRVEAGLIFDYVNAATANQFAVVDDDLVGHGGLPQIIEWDAESTTTKRLQFRGLETPYTLQDQQVDAGVPGRSVLRGEQLRTRRLRAAIERGRFSRAVAAVAASGVNEGTLDFSSDNDPISALQSAIETLLTACPVPRSYVRVLFGGSGWVTLLQHAYLTGGGAFSRQLITQAQIAAHLDLAPGQILVSRVQAITNKQGKTTAKDVILGGTKVLIFIGTDSPNEEDPSFGKSFAMRTNGQWMYAYRNTTHEGLGIYNLGLAYWELMAVTFSSGLTRYAISTT